MDHKENGSPIRDWSSYRQAFTEVTSCVGWLAGARDKILVAGAGIYILGYIVWAFNALVNELGLLPAADLQYFVAGLVPAGTLILFYIALRLLLAAAIRGSRWFVGWCDPLRRATRVAIRQRRKMFRWGTAITGLTLMVAGLALATWEPLESVGFPMFGIGFWVLVLGVPVIWWLGRDVLDRDARNPIEPGAEPAAADVIVSAGEGRFLIRVIKKGVAFWLEFSYGVLRWGIGLSVALYLVALGLVWLAAGILFLVLVVYPAIPQELGGIRPRCAHLEIASAKVTPQTLREFVPDLDMEVVAEVVRTGPVEVMFSKGDLLLVRPMSGNQETSQRVYQLRGDVVRAAFNCDPE